MTLTIHLARPNSQLGPNARVHWAARSRMVAASRRTAETVAAAVWHGITPPRWAYATARVLWVMPSKAHHPDPDNAIACLKSSLDGLAAWGVVANDRGLIPVWEGLRVDPAYVDDHGLAWPKGCVRLTFSPVDIGGK